MKKILIFSVLAIVFILVYVFIIPLNFMDDRQIEVNIPDGSSAKQISLILDTSGIILNPVVFQLTVKSLGVGSALKSGDYMLKPSMNNFSIISKLVSGDTFIKMRTITIPEGSSIYRISKILEEGQVTVEGGSFEALTSILITGELLSKYPFLNNRKSLEGYLFPDTYSIPAKVNIEKLVDMMLRRFNEVVIPQYDSVSAKKPVLSQILIIASLIEKEAKLDEERSVIASVIYNRLGIGMKLDLDPTIKYALELPGKVVSYNDLKVNSPYNTYKNKGLPPGPICNPGLKSIKAALYPATTKYLFFVSNNDGSHTFSENIEQHNKAVARFRTLRQNPKSQ